ncbi:MAG TPA: short-chain dehydrogenase [Chitinophagaceae bacterium]|nr:short-chain dehydrogenase [Chitinophagaceae bacterium]
MKKRNPIRGLIVKGKDYQELKGKNFWRIVTLTHMNEYNKSQNINLAKIFSGTEFAKLSLVNNKPEE